MRRPLFLYFLLSLIHISLLCRLAGNGAPERGSDDVGGLLQGQALAPNQIIYNVGDDLGIGQQITFVAIHFDLAPVGVV